MKAVLIFIFQVNIGIALFYIGYLLLRKNTFFQANRIYLIMGLILPFAMPFIKLKDEIQIAVSQITMPVIDVGANQPIAETQMDTSLIEVVFFVFVAGALVALIKLLFAVVSLAKAVKNGNKQKQQHCTIVYGNNDTAASSFFKYVFMPGNENTETGSILKHELVHVKQRHSIDILLVELLKALFWFNPALYLYKNAIEETHEFIADSKALDHTISSQQYTNLLLGQAFGLVSLPMVNAFFKQSLIKKRIKMIHKTKTNKAMVLKYAVVLPVLAATVLTVACTKNELNIQPSEGEVQQLVYTIAEEMPQYPGGQSALMAYLGSNIKYPKKSKEAGISGTVYINFLIDKNGKVSNAKVLQGVNDELDIEAMRVIEAMPNWSPGKQDGQPVAVSYNIPIRYALSKEDLPAPPPPPPGWKADQ